MKKAIVIALVLVFSVLAFAADEATAVSGVNEAGKLWSDHGSAARGIAGGVDLDGDGYLEFYTTSYDNGGVIHGFEAIGGDTLEHFWTSDTAMGAGLYESGTRFVQTGDIDGDGAGEVIFFRGRYASQPGAGLYIYEIDSDNTFKEKIFYDIDALSQIFNFNGVGTTISNGRVEHFVVRDVDNDGFDEIIVAWNGNSYVTDYIDTTATDTTAYGHSEDFIAVLSATDDLQGFGRFQCEFITSPRDIDMGVLGLDKDDPMFGRDNRLGGGSPTAVEVCDTDGDGLKEIVCFVWNYNNVFFIEATGPDSYTFGDTTYQYLSDPDGVCLLQPVVGDIDSDGYDEVYYMSYPDNDCYMIEDLNGDATNFDSTEYIVINDGPNDPRSIYGGVMGDIDGDGNNELIFGGSISTGDINIWDGDSWTSYKSVEPDTNMYKDAVGGAATKFLDKLVDIDNDGYMEVVACYQSEVDSIDQYIGDEVTRVANPYYSPIRVIEFGDDVLGPVTAITPTIISPDDYKLGKAYPNPFNPTTSISYTLPMAKEVSLKVYNVRGELVSVLVDNQRVEEGTHNVVWDATNMSGAPLATGVYVYTLTYGNFSKSEKMTLLK
ncbi:MAG: T9SS type A sorting domain-containing protein [Candidatus Neomarinimicrobiota bacterium]